MTANNNSKIPEFIERFDKHQRYQHFLLFISMFFLFLTGFPIKYADTGFARFVVSLFNGFDHMFTVHLVCAVIMVLSGIYHIIWLVIKFDKNGASFSMAPSFKDIKDAYHHALYLLGLRKERPQYGRYSYLEKFEYLAVIYGIILMGLSGFILWFPNLAAAIMPRWVIEMFRIAHSNEALVALFAVALGHFFWVHFNPDAFPTSPVWYNGKISREHLQEEHPLEYAKIAEKYGESTEELPKHKSRFARSNKFMAIELIIYTIIFVAILSKFLMLLFS